MTAKSITKGRIGKPDKPRPDFPLYAHATGCWAKKIRGKLHYFGPWSKPEEALAKYLDQRDDLAAGRKPRRKDPDALTVMALCNQFMNFKRRALVAGELAQRSHDVCYDTCQRMIAHFGKTRLADDLTPEDFGDFRAWLAKGRGPVWLKNEITRVKSVFRYGLKAGLLERPAHFGLDFERPSAKVLRVARQKKGTRMFAPEQVRAALDVAPLNTKAMMLLALNCGLGNTDLGLLPIRSIDIERGILDFPRSKTATERVVPLWPETVAAVRDALEHRPEPIDPADADLLFIRPRSRDNYVGDHTGTRVGGAIRVVLTKAKIKGRTAYDFRRTFQTIGEGARDLPAVQAIMGHAAGQSDMSAVYRQQVDMERKRAVVNHVRKWLFPKRKPR